MKKGKYLIFFSLLILFSSFKLEAINAVANTVTPTYEESGEVYFDDANQDPALFLYKYLDTGEEVFCLNNSLLAPKAVSCTKRSEFTDAKAAGFAYIINDFLEKKNSSPTKDANHKIYLLSQIAIHIYNGEKKDDVDYATYAYGHLTPERKATVESILANARNAENSVNNFDLTLTQSSNKLVQSGDWFMSEPITVNMTGGTSWSVVTNNSSAQIYDKTSTSFRIKIPVASLEAGDTSIKATVTANNTFNKGVDYDCGTYQPIMPILVESKTIQKEKSVDFTLTKTKFSIAKVDENQKPLSGVKLAIYDSEGSREIESWVTTDTAKVIEGLPAGTYILRELQVPSGYQSIDKDIYFTLALNSTITFREADSSFSFADGTFTISNKRKTYSFTLTKLNSKTHEVVEGAVFKLYKSDGETLAKYANGNTVGDLTTNSSGQITVNNLYAGTYILKEIQAPIGYKINPNPTTIIITEDMKINPSYTVYDVPMVYSFKIIKKDSENEALLKGAVFRLYKNDQKTVATDADGTEIADLTTDQKGVIEVDNLLAGTYYLKEIKAPKGYQLKKDLVKIVLTLGMEEVPVYTVTNKPIIKEVKISKQDITNQEELPGATIEIRDANKDIAIDSKTNEELSFISTDEPKLIHLRPGRYTLKETIAPEPTDECLNSLDPNLEVESCNYEALENELEFRINDDETIEVLSDDNEFYEVTDDMIVIYNNRHDIPKIPKTASNINYFMIIIGAILILLGGYGIYYILMKRKESQF